MDAHSPALRTRSISPSPDPLIVEPSRRFEGSLSLATLKAEHEICPDERSEANLGKWEDEARKFLQFVTESISLEMPARRGRSVRVFERIELEKMEKFLEDLAEHIGRNKRYRTVKHLVSPFLLFAGDPCTHPYLHCLALPDLGWRQT